MKPDNIEAYEGGLETTYIKVHDINEDMSIVLTFFPETNEEVEVEMSAEEFYQRLVRLEPYDSMASDNDELDEDE